MSPIALPTSPRLRSLLLLSAAGCLVIAPGCANGYDAGQIDGSATPPGDTGGKPQAEGGVVVPPDPDASVPVPPGDGGNPGHPSDGGVLNPDAGGYGWVGTINPTSGFRHPGVVITQGALNYVRDQLVAGNAPWKAALGQLKIGATCDNSKLKQPCGALPYTITAPSSFTSAGPNIATCGSHSLSPDGSCSAEKADSLAAYTDALLWYISGDEQYAVQAIAIMNAWNTFKGHSGTNSPLQAGWVGSVWPRAAELIRYTYPQSKYSGGWSDADATSFQNMLKAAYYSDVGTVALQNGNWELSLADAQLQMAVFNDDKATFDSAVQRWKDRVSVYFFLAADGTPKTPPTVKSGPTDLAGDGWFGIASATGLPDGTAQETCRDLEHVQYGIGAALNAAETAKIQGTDLYADATSQGGPRLFAAMEFHAGLLKGRTNASPDLSNATAPPIFACNSSTGSSTGSIAMIDHSATVAATLPIQPTWEAGYNEFVNREGKSMPNTKALLDGNRPMLATHHLDWETITHAEVGAKGLP